MGITIIGSGDGYNLEVPLTEEQLKTIKDSKPKHLKLGDHVENLLMNPDEYIEPVDLPEELVARIKRDIVISLIEHFPSKDGDFIIDEAKKLAKFCTIKQ